MKIKIRSIALIAALLLLADRGLTGCIAQTASAELPPAVITAAPSPTAAPPIVGTSYSDSSDGGHAILADGETRSYANITVSKTGDAEGDKADFYGENAAVLAQNAAELNLRVASVTTDGSRANAVFSYGTGTVVNIADSTINTSGHSSGGLMTADGAAMNANNLVVHTAGNSSAAIRSDGGGSLVNVTGGIYKTDGVGSPAIFSAADIRVTDAELGTTASQGAVIEGTGSVTLQSVTLTANHAEKNSGESPWYQAIMLCRSSADGADEGTATFTMLGGGLTNLNGDIFFVTNTHAVINLTGADIVNDDPDGVFLRAAAAGWGRAGENGGHVELYTAAQRMEGDLLTDALSTLKLCLGDSSILTGAVNPDNEGEVSVSLTDGAKWVLTGDSYVKSLRCDADSIDLNGFTLYVDGVIYTAGTAMEGSPAAA